MTSFLVTYDLTGPERDYPKLIEHLKSYGTYSRAVKSTWLIVSDLSCEDIRNAVAKQLDSDDKLLVVELTGSAAWLNLRDATDDWIQRNL